ncbi:MAG: hypothetical protein IJ824_05965 [Alphaproteobacteria bacterium]|nr:hypothetical protein [Alphaproteobacteria bacterium]
MKRLQLATLFVLGAALLWGANAKAEAEHEMMNSYFDDVLQTVEIKEMSEETDNAFNADVEIVPLKKSLSAEESMLEDSSDLSVIDSQPLTALNCNNPKLKEQVEHFIYKNINQKDTNSVLEKRRRLLMVRNMADFEEIDIEQIDSKADFETLAALAYMKINKHIEINKICRSQQNRNDKFKNIYAVLYTVAGYYKVVVTNLMPVTDKMDEATFIFTW